MAEEEKKKRVRTKWDTEKRKPVKLIDPNKKGESNAKNR